MKTKQRNYSKMTLKRLFAVSYNTCAFPDCEKHIVTNDGVVVGDICHINAYSPKGPRYNPKQTDEERESFENLILMCKEHHKIIDSNARKFNTNILKDYKSKHEDKTLLELDEKNGLKANLLITNFIKNIEAENASILFAPSGANQINTVIVKTSKKPIIKTNPYPDTIGADLEMRSYVKYLIDRYNEFASKSENRTSNFKFPVIYKNIEQNFGCKWDNIHESRFEELSQYLKMRISRTEWARKLREIAEELYHSFQVHIDKMNSSKRK